MEIEKLKQKILDLAIRGKLVPQDPNDEPASVLIEKIKAEREKLVKQGKIKKAKDESFIYKGSDNSYYEKIPNNWVCLKLQYIASITMGQSPDGSDISDKETENSLEFHQGKLAFTNYLINNSNKYAIKYNKVAEKDSLLFCVRAPVGEINFTNRQVAIGRGLCAVKSYNSILTNQYLYYVLLWLKPYFIKNGTGSTFNAITVDVLKNVVIPIPSLKEQAKIVSTLDQAFKLLLSIKTEKSRIEFLSYTLKTKILDFYFNHDSSYKSYYEQCSILEDVEILDNLRKPINKEERLRRLSKSNKRYPYYGATGNTGEIDDYLYDGELVLLGEDGAPFLDKTANKAYLVDGKFWVNNHAHMLRSKTNNKFLMYYLNWVDYTKYVSGTTRLKLSQGNLIKIPFIRCSSEIKEKIVEKIEVSFEYLDKISQ